MILVMTFGLSTVAPPAMADHCRGDLYCDGAPKPCSFGGLLYPCSAGDASVIRR
jgi:hypothetical protein